MTDHPEYMTEKERVLVDLFTTGPRHMERVAELRAMYVRLGCPEDLAGVIAERVNVINVRCAVLAARSAREGVEQWTWLAGGS